MSSAHMLHRGE